MTARFSSPEERPKDGSRWSAWRPGERSLLLTLCRQDAVESAVRMAVEMANALQAQLHILRVSPLSQRSQRGSTRAVVDALHVAEEALAADQGCRSVRDGLPAGQGLASVAVLSGDFIACTAAYAQAVDATSIILAGGDKTVLRRARELERITRRPVLLPAFSVLEPDGARRASNSPRSPDGGSEARPSQRPSAAPKPLVSASVLDLPNTYAV